MKRKNISVGLRNRIKKGPGVIIKMQNKFMFLEKSLVKLTWHLSIQLLQGS